jgi:hypothetical protein
MRLGILDVLLQASQLGYHLRCKTEFYTARERLVGTTKHVHVNQSAEQQQKQWKRGTSVGRSDAEEQRTGEGLGILILFAFSTPFPELSGVSMQPCVGEKSGWQSLGCTTLLIARMAPVFQRDQSYLDTDL